MFAVWCVSRERAVVSTIDEHTEQNTLAGALVKSFLRTVEATVRPMDAMDKAMGLDAINLLLPVRQAVAECGFGKNRTAIVRDVERIWAVQGPIAERHLDLHVIGLRHLACGLAVQHALADLNITECAGK